MLTVYIILAKSGVTSVVVFSLVLIIFTSPISSNSVTVPWFLAKYLMFAGNLPVLISDIKAWIDGLQAA